jgi:hypothetical protein
MFRTEDAEEIDTHTCCLIHCAARFTKKRHALSNSIMIFVQLCPCECSDTFIGSFSPMAQQTVVGQPSYCRGFTITLRHTAPGGTPSDE